jgi:hypothetical protein
MSKLSDTLCMALILLAFVLGFTAALTLAKTTTFIDSKHEQITQKCIDITALGKTQEYCK